MKPSRLDLTLINFTYGSVISKTDSVILTLRTAAENADVCCATVACVGNL